MKWDNDLDTELQRYWKLDKAKCSKSYLEFQAKITLIQEIRNLRKLLEEDSQK